MKPDTPQKFQAIQHIRAWRGPSHTCFECGVEIGHGEEYLAVSGPFDGEYNARFQHIVCHEVWICSQKDKGVILEVRQLNLKHDPHYSY
jgi:hypothetical protein